MLQKCIGVIINVMCIDDRIKQGILQALINEQEKLVKNAIAQFIGIIGKHEFPNKTWPEVLQFVQSLCSSQNVIDREVTVFFLLIFYSINTFHFSWGCILCQ